MKVEEGKRYTFDVKKIINFDNSKYFVLRGPDEKSYMLDASIYASYNIETGKKLRCRVDKINCKGEVFLEPDHPFYTEGKEYPFTFAFYDERLDKSGRKCQVAVVRDKEGNQVVVPIDTFGRSLPQKGDKVIVRVSKIMKGQISAVAGKQNTAAASVKFREQGAVEFLIENIYKGVDGKDYYRVLAPSGDYYSMPVSYYSHYGLSVGERFPGRYIRYKKGHKVNVEPLSPFFDPGKVYRFTVHDFIEPGEGLERIMLVRDDYDYLHRLYDPGGYVAGDNIYLRVEKMRKGWPLLVSSDEKSDRHNP